ncbi:hypothetical protein [uncultured Jatrophihabitans sp.]|uniref:hypothetical protein n=1 Tax=uncultured Jatrophihabitans sp. TaxID=1610747 RepID=UPI0035CA4070
MRNSIKLVSVAAVCAAVLSSTAVAADAATGARPTVRVHGTSKHRVVAPASLAPGFVHLKNTGSEVVGIFRARGHAGQAALRKDLNGGSDRLLKQFKLQVVLGHADTFVRLRRGTYFLADAEREHYSAKDLTRVHVAGATRNAKLPAAQLVTVDKHNRLHGPATAHRRSWLKLRNFDGRPQALLGIKIGSHTTDAELAEFVANPSDAALDGLDIVDIDPFGELSGHDSAYYRFTGGKGRYIVLTIPAVQSSKGSGESIVKHRVKLLTIR